LKSRHFKQSAVFAAVDQIRRFAVWIIVICAPWPSMQCFADEYFLADYPKGDLPYITLSCKPTDLPFWGNVLEYELAFSPNFPFDKSSMKFVWSGEVQTQSETAVAESANVLKFGYLINQEAHKTTLKVAYNQQSTATIFLWQPPHANIVARYKLLLAPFQEVTLAAWGFDALPQGAFAFFHFGDIWQAGTVFPLAQSPDSLSLTLLIDGLPSDLKGYRPVEETMMRNDFPGLQLFDHIKFTPDEYNDLSERYRQMIALYRQYELSRCQYRRGMASLDELLEIKVLLLQELTQMLQIYQTPATVAEKSLRDQEILQNISQIIALRTEQYKAGVMSLDELNGIKDKLSRVQKMIEARAAHPAKQPPKDDHQ